MRCANSSSDFRASSAFTGASSALRSISGTMLCEPPTSCTALLASSSAGLRIRLSAETLIDDAGLRAALLELEQRCLEEHAASHIDDAGISRDSTARRKDCFFRLRLCDRPGLWSVSRRAPIDK